MTIMTTRAGWPLWEPPNETLETVAAVIASHWNAASKAYREKLFWPDGASWLGALVRQAPRERYHYHFTRGGRLIR